MKRQPDWKRHVVLGLLLLSGAMTTPVVAQTRLAARPEFAWTTINYLSGSLVYLGVGTKQGVRQGTHLEVLRGGQVIAELTTAYTSSNQASCTVTKSTATVSVGDSVRYIAVVDSQPANAAGRHTLIVGERRWVAERVRGGAPAIHHTSSDSWSSRRAVPRDPDRHGNHAYAAGS